MVGFFKKYLEELILILMIFIYVVYFSLFTILRHQRLFSGYYDLAIMDQTVYNTQQGRILELTNPDGLENIKRMAIHNDVLLAFLAPFYFIYQGPETLLVIQSVVLALGAIPLYLLAVKTLNSKLFGLTIAFSYLLYPPLQRSNIFDFHPVTLSTALLLFLVYFVYVKKYFLSFVFFILAILTKENVALTTAMLALYLVYDQLRTTHKLYNTVVIYSLTIFIISLFWFVSSVWFIIPYFRQSAHFALSRYQDFGETSFGVIKGIILKPEVFFKYIWHKKTLDYFFLLLFPVSFFPFFAPFYFLISTPELLINLLSKNFGMRMIIYHYTSVITPFVFLATIFGVKKILAKFKLLNLKKIIFILFVFSLLSSYFYSPLPYSRQADLYPLVKVRPEIKDVKVWKNILKNEKLIICASEHLASHFSQREKLYRFPNQYQKADYVVILKDDIYKDWLDKKNSIRAYQELTKDNNFKQIYKKENFEVYKKI